MKALAQVLGAIYVLAWVLFSVITLLTLPAGEVRKHALAAFLTAVVCGAMWPLLAWKDMTGTERE